VSAEAAASAETTVNARTGMSAATKVSAGASESGSAVLQCGGGVLLAVALPVTVTVARQL